MLKLLLKILYGSKCAEFIHYYMSNNKLPINLNFYCLPIYTGFISVRTSLSEENFSPTLFNSEDICDIIYKLQTENSCHNCFWTELYF